MYIRKTSNTLLGRLLLNTLFLFVSVAWSSSLFAADDSALDVVLVMDSSGSMKKTDPGELRKPAAKLLLSLLAKEDRASVVSFSDQGYPIAYLTPIKNQQNQDLLFSAVEKISSKGGYTNIAGAIKTAHKVLNQSKQPGHRQIIILMSDGQMDLGAQEKDKEATRELVKAVLPELKNAGIEVHTIAFTDSSDKPLLQSIANLTDGHFNIAKTDRDLHGVFTAIFEQNKDPDILPFEGETFSIDGDVKEVTIVATKDLPTAHIVLTTPDNVRMDAVQKPESVKWLVSEQFDLITIQAPKAGEWKLTPPAEKNRAYIITDLKLKLETIPEHPQPGDQLNIKVWLEDQGILLDKQAVLSTLQIDLIQDLPDGSYQKMAMYSPRDHEGKLSGHYGAEVLLKDPGRYRVEVTATTGTFERTKSRILDVIKPMDPNQVVNALESGNAAALIALPGVEVTKPLIPPKKEHTPVPEPKPEVPKVEVPKHEVPVKPEQPVKAEVPAEPVHEEESGAVTAIIIFVIFNLVLGGIAAALFFWMKKKKTSSGDGKGKEEATKKNLKKGEKESPDEPKDDELLLDEKKSSKKVNAGKTSEEKGDESEGEMLFEEMPSGQDDEKKS